MYSAILARDIKAGFVISLSMQQDRRKYYVLRILDNGNSDSIQFVAKPYHEYSDQVPRPFTLKSDLPLFSKGLVKFKHSHYWS